MTLKKLILFHTCLVLLGLHSAAQNHIQTGLQRVQSYRLTKQTTAAFKSADSLYRNVPRTNNLFAAISGRFLDVIHDSIIHLEEVDTYTKNVWNNTLEMTKLYFEVYNTTKQLINTSSKADMMYRNQAYKVNRDMIVAYNGLHRFEEAIALKPQVYDWYFSELAESGVGCCEDYFQVEKFIYHDYYIDGVEFFMDQTDDYHEGKKMNVSKHFYSVHPVTKSGIIQHDSCLFMLGTIKTDTTSDFACYTLAKHYQKNKRYNALEYIPASKFNAPIDGRLLHQAIIEFLDNKTKTDGKDHYIHH